MVFLRRLGLGLAVSIFTLLLVVFALCAGLFFVLDSPTPLKDALQRSGIYSGLVETILAQKQKEGGEASAALENDTVRQAAVQAFSPAYLQTTTEQTLERTYDWIHGTTPRLDLSVDLSGPKGSFADAIAAHLRQRLAALPACNRLVAPPTDLNSLLALTCKPPLVPDETIVATARQQALDSKLFNGISFMPGGIKDTEGQSLGDKFKLVPAAHRYFIISLYVVPFLLILCMLAIIFWSATRRGGTIRVARLLLVTGILTVLGAFLAVWALDKVIGMYGKNYWELAAVQDQAVYVVQTLATQLRAWWTGFGAGYILIAIALILTVKFMDKGRADDAEKLTQSLGYNKDIPTAGTKFKPKG